MLARAKRGETVEITERGVVVARIVPARRGPFDDLVAAGEIRPAALGGTVLVPLGPVRTDREAGEVLRRMRDEERF